ncbi:MAG: ABC transporter ATP-binding protein [Phenylobacterium sp.]|jgi:putative ABC transport system ATP-binding protein|uniref:ABC transporter ATP-binding protein n=1 Tax=Phenylobacterium sp. TaxID=1871053 RepID=UPI002A35CAEB|nr:ABC transporter ATP-binding protein [Phenylobacterium sp.]MDX9997506.1 ABC transporter ATP-binding protein [Phenylobacterium sp.]
MPSPAGAPLVRLTGLSKSVPGGRRLFDGLELTLAPGEFVAVMGESGVGKSTLLNLVGGLDAPDAGEVEIEGVALSGLSDDARTLLRRDRIGFVFQAFHILPHLTLAQNVALPMVLQKRPSAEALARAREMLAAVGLDGRSEDYPQQLSGGELQRIAIARALAHRPALVLADEPTGNLDPETAARVLALFEEQVRRAGTGVLLVTHSEAAAAAADRVLRLTGEGLEARDGG